MKYLILLSTTTFFLLTGCRKKDFQYDTAGVYDITHVRQEVMKNGEVISTSEESTDGVLVLRQGSVPADSRWSLELETNMTLVAWEELSGIITKRYWDASQDDERLSLIVENDYTIRKALMFTITKRKKKSLELMYVGTANDANNDLIETFEYYTLKLRD